MASRQGSKSRKAGLKGADSTASSTTSSSKLYQETSIDGHSSPASSSAQSKQQFFSPDPLPQTAQRSKENVTVTVRFRPLRFLVICLHTLAKIRLMFVLRI
jgi:centromeric protein E